MFVEGIREESFRVSMGKPWRISSENSTGAQTGRVDGQEIYFYQIVEPKSTRHALPGGFTEILWRPSICRWVPPACPWTTFAVWWGFHYGHLFRNREYAVFLIARGTDIVHRSCVFPGYFRFPFMAAGDLQIGDTWTAEAARGLGLASCAMDRIVRRFQSPGRTFWYVTDKGNVSSTRVAEKAGFSLAGEGVRTKRWRLRILGAYVLNSSQKDEKIDE